MPERALRILQVNFKDIRGGAAQVSWNLHRAYREKGLDASIAVAHQYSHDPYTFKLSHEKYQPAVIRFLHKSGRKLEAASLRLPKIGLGRLGGRLVALSEYRQRRDVKRGREVFYAPGTEHLLDLISVPPDILHLHNLHKNWGDYRSFFDLRALPKLSAKTPTVITLHDAWLLSGHCAHSLECERWRSGCGQCPDLGIYPAIRRDATADNWQRKHEIYRQSRLHIITPSEWLMQKVEKSMLVDGMISSLVIPNGVDLSIFHPGQEDRIALGLPQDSVIILFAADGIRTNKMKDFQTLQCAIERVAEETPNLVFIALGEEGAVEHIGRAELHFVPYQDDAEFVARFYRLADVYVHASRADTFPNSVIESLACGTPVVATAVGGIPEQIRDGETGFLTPAGDVAEMALKIKELLTNPDLRQHMGQAAAKDAAARFDLKQQTEHYLEFYNEIVGGALA